MKKLLPFLLLFLAGTFAGPASAQKGPKIKAKRAFSHPTESSKGKTNRMKFRHEGTRPVIDLKPRSLEKSKTIKAPKPYKYSKGKPLKPVK